MQESVVFCVMGDEDPAVASSKQQVLVVVSIPHAQITGQHDVVARSAKQEGKPMGNIVIKVESHHGVTR